MKIKYQIMIAALFLSMCLMSVSVIAQIKNDEYYIKCEFDSINEVGFSDVFTYSNDNKHGWMNQMEYRYQYDVYNPIHDYVIPSAGIERGLIIYFDEEKKIIKTAFGIVAFRKVDLIDTKMEDYINYQCWVNKKIIPLKNVHGFIKCICNNCQTFWHG